MKFTIIAFVTGFKDGVGCPVRAVIACETSDNWMPTEPGVTIPKDALPGSISQMTFINDKGRYWVYVEPSPEKKWPSVVDDWQEIPLKDTGTGLRVLQNFAWSPTRLWNEAIEEAASLFPTNTMDKWSNPSIASAIRVLKRQPATEEK